MSLHPEIAAVLAGESEGCIVTGNSLEVMADMPDGCIEMGCADPPFGVGLKYDTDLFIDTQEWWNDNVPKAVDHLLRICFGPVLCWGSAPKILENGNRFSEKHQRLIIWAPSFTLSKTMSNGMFWRWLPIFAWRLPKKHKGPTFDIMYHSCSGHDWWYHPGTRPLNVMVDLCGLASPESIIIDPFCGSGTTCVAAKKLGRKFIGIELVEKYADIARKRIEQTPAPRIVDGVEREVKGKSCFF